MELLFGNKHSKICTPLHLTDEVSSFNFLDIGSGIIMQDHRAVSANMCSKAELC
jgi:hypothetical protein